MRAREVDIEVDIVMAARLDCAAARQVDGCAATPENILSILVGCDEPGSKVLMLHSCDAYLCIHIYENHTISCHFIINGCIASLSRVRRAGLRGVHPRA